MNLYTEKSIELANQRNYLDLLFKVYPLSPDSIRDIDTATWKSVEKKLQKGGQYRIVQEFAKTAIVPSKRWLCPIF